jgi:hypothetical protein
LATAREAEVNEQGKIEGIDIDRVSAWMAERTPLTRPLAFKLIAGGRSNMTFMVTDAAGRRFVLRRPPLGKLLPSASRFCAGGGGAERGCLSDGPPAGCCGVYVNALTARCGDCGGCGHCGGRIGL